MDENKLFNALDGLWCYDDGAVDVGIKDEVLREEIIYYLKNLSEDQFKDIIAKFIRLKLASEDAIKKGFGIEDIKSFITWLSEKMGFK